MISVASGFQNDTNNRTAAKGEKIMKMVTRPSQMRKPLSWNPICEEWKNNLQKDDVWWYKNEPDADNPRELEQMKKMFLLKDRLLSFGGELACLAFYEKDYDAIMERGQFWYGEHIRFKKGLPSQCHFNSARMWDVNRGKCQIATGYALSDDGCWRQHSWVVQPLATKYRLWETTESRIAYFGFVMTDEECERFLNENE